jgi:hypothetical protein
MKRYIKFAKQIVVKNIDYFSLDKTNAYSGHYTSKKQYEIK